MTDQEMLALFDPIYVSLSDEDEFKKGLPLLAHYTSINVMESILKTSEIWFSNPLFMNDLQEMRFGLNEGSRLFSNSELQKKAAGTDKRAAILQHAFSHFFQTYDSNEAFDTYVFCLSEHDRNNIDGLLSMWRGYGQHGNGVALVFDASAVTLVPNSPFVISKVRYASDEDRLTQLDTLLKGWADISGHAALPDDKLYLAAHAAMHAIKTFALTTKHKGFSEEAEWRVVYHPDRDRGGMLKQFLGYHIGERGVEPKLKYPLGYIADVSPPDLSLEKILDRIILGPSLSSALARRSIERMVEKMDRPQYKDKLCVSGIPLRPGSGLSF